jgi:hypothetical protein
LPFVEFAEVCFKAAKWMPQGAAAEVVRKNGGVEVGLGVSKDRSKMAGQCPNRAEGRQPHPSEAPST